MLTPYMEGGVCQVCIVVRTQVTQNREMEAFSHSNHRLAMQ